MNNCYFQKTAGGILLPANDETAEFLTGTKTGSYFKTKITKVRNYRFHQKMFAFFNFCFAHWAGELDYVFMDERAQFEVFRKQLVILAGYRKPVVNLRNKKISYEAESLSYDSMDEERFTQCYNALIQAAMKHIFNESDELTYNKLISFF